jgi:hypothetical protein
MDKGAWSTGIFLIFSARHISGHIPEQIPG